MSAGGSKIAIFTAIGANILIAISKFIASAFTGSSAMLSEGIHSLIDTLNGFLLLLGIKRSKKAPTKLHPFGYGMETYFWSFIVSILVFSVGGGVAIYEGIVRLTETGHEVEHGNIWWNYGVLISAMIFEGSSLMIGLKQFRKDHPHGFRKALKDSKDAPTVAVIIEETAAVSGLLIALIGVSLSYFSHDPIYDAIASVLIGLLLVYVAYFMANETKHLLIGEAASDEDINQIKQVIDEYDEIDFYGNIRTMHLGPHEVLAAIEVNYKDDISIARMEEITNEIEINLKKVNSAFKYVYVESNNIDHSII